MRKLFGLMMGMTLALGCVNFVHAQETVEKDKTKVEDHGKVVKEKTTTKDQVTGKHNKTKVKVKDKGNGTEVKVKGK